MDPESFAATRKSFLTSTDEALEPFVEDALHGLLAGDPDWEKDLVTATSDIWMQVFEEESDGAKRGLALGRFRKELRAALEKTSDPGMDVQQSQVDRITHWLSGYTVNSATVAGGFARGIRHKRWTTMLDDDVRDIHVAASGQIVPISGTFTVGGEQLQYPGQPVGDPEVWIQCRCLAQPASRDGEAMSGTTYTIGPEDGIEDNPDIIPGSDVIAASAVIDEEDIAVEPVDEEDLPDDDEELITEIPVHGVLAPEGVSTGDGRKFAIGALSVRDLPLPLRYETIGTHGGDTSMVVTVGRIDNAWRDDATNMWRYTGAIVLTKPYAQEVIDGLVDGTIRGISIDGDAAEVEVQELSGDEMDDGQLLEMLMGGGETVFSKMRVSAATIVPIPAFQEAYTALGLEFQEDLSDEDREAQREALQACGCLTGEYREFPPEQREKDAENGNAMPDGSYPIENCEDLANAIQAIGRASDPEATKAHIRKRHAALDCPEIELPEDWSSEGVFAGRSQDTAFAPGTHDGPGWITDPIPTERIRRYWVSGEGAAKIKWGAPGDFNRCRAQLAKYVQNPDWLAGLCANMHYEALGFWPAQHHSVVSEALIASAGTPIARLAEPEHQVYPAEWFSNPNLGRAVPLRIESDTRRVYGYVAEWGVCHVGMAGMCQEVPRSTSNYGYYLKGLVDTDQGEQPVGVLSFGGHASRGASMARASDYYDKPEAVRAFVNVGEDEFGVWFAGVVPPDVTDADIAKMRAIGAVSGDWREVRGSLELIGVPVVNTPGFPVLASASGGRQTSLIGAGALRPEVLVASAVIGLDAETAAGIVRATVAEYRHQEKVAARAEPARAKVRERRLAAARARVEREG